MQACDVSIFPPGHIVHELLRGEQRAENHTQQERLERGGDSTGGSSAGSADGRGSRSALVTDEEEIGEFTIAVDVAPMPQREAQEMERDPLRSRKFRFRKFRRLRRMGRGLLGGCLWMRKGVRLRKARGRVEGLLRRCLGGGKVAMTLIGRWEILCESNLNTCALSSPTM